MCANVLRTLYTQRTSRPFSKNYNSSSYTLHQAILTLYIHTSPYSPVLVGALVDFLLGPQELDVIEIHAGCTPHLDHVLADLRMRVCVDVCIVYYT
jgi:hypothetical protein